jgi:hypothetical protein
MTSEAVKAKTEEYAARRNKALMRLRYAAALFERRYPAAADADWLGGTAGKSSKVINQALQAFSVANRDMLVSIGEAAAAYEAAKKSREQGI